MARRERLPLERVAYSVAEVAALTGATTGAIYDGVKTGTIRAVRLGKRILIPVSELDGLKPTDPKSVVPAGAPVVVQPPAAMDQNWLILRRLGAIEDKLDQLIQTVTRGARPARCKVCGQPFLAQRSDAVYCSPRCRSRAHEQRTSAPAADA